MATFKECAAYETHPSAAGCAQAASDVSTRCSDAWRTFASGGGIDDGTACGRTALRLFARAAAAARRAPAPGGNLLGWRRARNRPATALRSLFEPPTREF